MNSRPSHRRLGAALVLRVSASDVGRRVTLRTGTRDDATGDLVYNDLVGELLAWSDEIVTVRTRRRGDVTVPTATVLGGKVIPPITHRP